MSKEIDRRAEIVPWPESQPEMHICPSPDCCSEMMQPEHWEKVDNGKGDWQLWSFCGECLTHYVGVFNEEQIEEYDEILDGYTAEVSTALKELEHENMENFIDTFSTALQAELIGPEDF